VLARVRCPSRPRCRIARTDRGLARQRPGSGDPPRLKPENVILTGPEPRPSWVQVVDFGGRRMSCRRRNPAITARGVARRYGAPSCPRSSSADCAARTERSDLYGRCGLLPYRISRASCRGPRETFTMGFEAFRRARCRARVERRRDCHRVSYGRAQALSKLPSERQASAFDFCAANSAGLAQGVEPWSRSPRRDPAFGHRTPAAGHHWPADSATL